MANHPHRERFNVLRNMRTTREYVLVENETSDFVEIRLEDEEFEFIEVPESDQPSSTPSLPQTIEHASSRIEQETPGSLWQPPRRADYPYTGNAPAALLRRYPHPLQPSAAEVAPAALYPPPPNMLQVNCHNELAARQAELRTQADLRQRIRQLEEQLTRLHLQSASPPSTPFALRSATYEPAPASIAVSDGTRGPDAEIVTVGEFLRGRRMAQGVQEQQQRVRRPIRQRKRTSEVEDAGDGERREGQESLRQRAGAGGSSSAAETPRMPGAFWDEI
jgi:hypothetical protein